MRQPREFAGAVALERTQRPVVAVADQIGALDQFPHRLGDGAMEQEPDQQRRHDHGKHREDDFSAPLIEIFEDIAGRARGIDDAGDLVAHDDGHGGKNAQAGAAAHGMERGLVMLGDAHAQHRTEAPLQRFGHFRQMRQREPDLLAAGDDDAVGVEQPKARERDVLGGNEIRHHARAESDIGGVGGCGGWARFRPRRQHVLVQEFQPRPDRLIWLACGLLNVRRCRLAQCCALRNRGLDLAMKCCR